MHRADPLFWRHFRQLPKSVQVAALRNFRLLKADPRYPSLRFRTVGRYWSARVGDGHRAVAIREGGDFVWIWIGAHDEYIRFIGR